MRESNNGILNLDLLQIPLALKRELKHLCEELVASRGNKIASITVIGSAATSDFISGSSDLNLLVVFSDLELNDIDGIAAKVRMLWRRSKISPRFISKRNLMSSLRYFPIDFWTMQRSHVVVYGEDILKDIAIRKDDLLWQLQHEIKGLRMRLKQQFWRMGDDVIAARANLIVGFNTVIYLSKILLHLKGVTVPDTNDRIIEVMKNALNVDVSFAETAMLIKRRSAKLKRENIARLYEGLLKYIRAIDDIASQITL